MNTIQRDLPNDQFEAALAANAPTGLNPFATISDLAGFVSTNLYIADDNLTGNRTLTGANNSLTFTDLSSFTVNVNANGNATRNWVSGGLSISEGVGFNPTGFGENGATSSIITPGASANLYGGMYDFGGGSYVDFQAYIGAESTGFFSGPWGGAATSYSSMYFSNATVNNGFQADEFGERIISQSSGLTRLSSLPAATGIAFLSGAGGTGYIGVSDQAGFSNWMNGDSPTGWGGVYEKSGTIKTGTVSTVTDTWNLLTPGANDRVYIGPTATTNIGLLNLKAKSNLNTGRIINIENNSGVERWMMQDDGQIGMYTGGAGFNAGPNANVGVYHQSRDYSIAHYIQGRTGTTTGLFVANGGSENNPFAIQATFNGNVTGLAIAIRALSWQASAQSNTGLYGSARNGSLVNVGVDGVIPGGSSVAPSAYSAAVRGQAGPNVNSESFGGLFGASWNNVGTTYTEDFIGVQGNAQGQNGDAASSGKIIGGKFFAGGITGTGNRMAINVPSTGNIGNIVLGADSSSPSATFVEIHNGAMEFVTAGEGFILKTPDGVQRYKYTSTNLTGALTITLLP